MNISFKREQWGMWNPRVLVLYQGKGGGGSVDPERRAVRFQGIPGRIAAKRAILESWCYTRRNWAASILAESRPIPGNSRWCSAWPHSREGGGVLSYTSGQQEAVVLFEVLRLYQGSVVDCICQVKSRFCLYQVTSKILFIPGHFQDSVYTRSFQDSVYTRSFQDSVYTRWCSFTRTSVRGAASAWGADTHQSSDCDGVCVTAFVTGR